MGAAKVMPPLTPKPPTAATRSASAPYQYGTPSAVWYSSGNAAARPLTATKPATTYIPGATSYLASATGASRGAVAPASAWMAYQARNTLGGAASQASSYTAQRF